MRGWLGLFAFLTACGGASQSDVFGEPSPTGTPTQTTDPPAGTTPPAGTGTTTPPDTKPCATATYYRDTDGDGFGGGVTQVACTSPGDGWVTKSGDCADDNKDVFPGQTAYFGTAYSKTGGAHSFDYDCSAKEDEKPPARKVAAATCAFVGNACTGDGVIALPRSGAGTDPLCGATQYQTCTVRVPGLSQCETKITTLEVPVACR